jgi:hypothetical protein
VDLGLAWGLFAIVHRWVLSGGEIPTICMGLAKSEDLLNINYPVTVQSRRTSFNSQMLDFQQIHPTDLHERTKIIKSITFVLSMSPKEVYAKCTSRLRFDLMG